MKKVSVVFHSVCGNNYLMAKNFYDSFVSKGAEVNLFRVKDDDYEKLSEMFETAKEFTKEISNVPIYDFNKLLESDIIIIGSPTYFGNVSAEIKVFMDEFAPYWVDASFYGKKLFAYTTAGTVEGGGDMCLRAINTFGQHLGMISIPVPCNLVKNESYTAYGFIHCVGDLADNRPGLKIKNAIDKMCDILIK
ncbi:flavodoxin family protein [Sedimentibacter sp. zth1]|uniref:flavodoxin family protein n=1 Tax=Sedimentibacter sp. zth1 TaxID=2816908 RepID=UPI001A90E99C|nr:flavodoxin family protein [Sedimentibacter sp. zth1]QSX05582.1 flavodoxin family protein [Sedimentibacter sp. zth1]